MWAGRRHRYSALVTVRTALTIFVQYSLLILDLALSSRIPKGFRNAEGTAIPGQALRVRGASGYQISRQSAHGCGKVSPKHGPP